MTDAEKNKTPDNHWNWLLFSLVEGCLAALLFANLSDGAERTLPDISQSTVIGFGVIGCFWLPIIGAYADFRAARTKLAGALAGLLLFLMALPYVLAFHIAPNFLCAAFSLLFPSIFYLHLSLLAQPTFSPTQRVSLPGIHFAVLAGAMLLSLIGVYLSDAGDAVFFPATLLGALALVAFILLGLEEKPVHPNAADPLKQSLAQSIEKAFYPEILFRDLHTYWTAGFFAMLGLGIFANTYWEDQSTSNSISDEMMLVLAAMTLWGSFSLKDVVRSLGARRALTLSMLLFTVTLVTAFFVNTTVEAGILFIVMAFLLGNSLPNATSLAMRFSPSEHAAMLCGFHGLAIGLGVAVSVLWTAVFPSAENSILNTVSPPVFLLVGLILLQYVNKERALKRADVGVEKMEPVLQWNTPKLSGQGRHTILTRFLQQLAKTLVEVFFGKLRVNGREHFVFGRAILVVNHPNTFLDPLLITTIAPGRLHFWAKSTLWNTPFLGSLLDRLGAIPVYRRKDYQDQIAEKNQKTMNIASEKLRKGAQILIFPEGVSEKGLSLKPIKTGAARLALSVLDGLEDIKDVPIIPIGLNYTEPSMFRTNVTINIGEPIWPRQNKERCTDDSDQAVKEITSEIRTRLKTLTPHLSSPELSDLVGEIESLYGERLLQILDVSDESLARRKIVDAINHYHELDPMTVHVFARRLKTYFIESQRLSTPNNHDPIPISELFGILRTLIFSITTIGVAGNWLPYRLTGSIVERLMPNPVWMGTFKLGLGTLVFSLYYLMLGVCFYLFAGMLICILLLIILMLSGVVALGALDRYAFRIKQLRTLWLAFWTQDTDDGLEDMKLSLIQDLERFREAYYFHISQAEEQ